MTTTTTCDECGKTAESSRTTLGWNTPPGWLTITGITPAITADTPRDYRRKQPDLCSLVCVAAWASRRAGLETAAS